MAEHGALLQILILLAATVAVVALAHRVKLPPIIGYLAVGMLVGPNVADVVENQAATQLLAEFGIVFLVFTLGLEFSLPRLIAMRWEVLGVGGGQVILTTAVVAGIAAWVFGIRPSVAVVVGGSVAMSSTAIIVSQLTEQGENNRTHGRLAVAICLFQDLAFTLFLAWVSALGARDSAVSPARIANAVATAIIALLIVIAAGRWLLRPLFMAIAVVRSAELFLLAVLLVVVGSAWATEAAGLSMALGAFLAGMMLAETEFRHQVEATIRSFRDVLIGLFFVTVGMLLDIALLFREILSVSAILIGMLVIKSVVAAMVARPVTHSWFKAARLGVVVSQGGEFGFALLTLLLGHGLLPAEKVQPLLAATILSMVISPLLIRHNRKITRTLLHEAGPQRALEGHELQSTRALAERDHVVICGFGRVGQNIARVLEQNAFEYIALDLDPARIRAARQAGDPLIYGDARQIEVLENVGLANATCVVITFASPAVSLRILASIRKLRADVPVLVRTQDDAQLEELQRAGATEVVPETFEASLMLLSHLLLLLKVPAPRVVRTIEDIRTHRYDMLRRIFRDEGARAIGRGAEAREAVSSVILPPSAWAVGKTIAEVNTRDARARVSAVRRDGIVGRDPAPDTVLKEGDVVVLHGVPEALEHAEGVLLMG